MIPEFEIRTFEKRTRKPQNIIKGGHDLERKSQMIKSSKMSGAKFIANTFKGYGVTHVFYVEGILRRSLVEMEALGIQRILTHSEKTAAYMADGYAKASGRPGVCMAQSVGAANLASGLQDPFLGFSPVIAISGRRPPITQYRHGYQEILHYVMFDPVTKFNARVETIEQLPYLLPQAFREATSGAPRPVHLEVCGYEGEMIDRAEADLGLLVEERFCRIPSIRPEPEADCVKEAVQILANAERPVIVAGGGAKTSSAGPEIIKLAELLSIPVATSLNAKDIIPEYHPLNVGVVGSYSRWCANQVVWESDMVLYVGSATGDQVTNSWTFPKQGTRVIQIDINPSELGRSYPNIVGLMGDAKVTVSKLAGCVKPKKGNSTWAQRAGQLVQRWRNEVEPLRNSDASPIMPERLCKEITDVLPEDGIMVSDTGNAAIWTGTMAYITHPGQSYIRCAGSLGWALPASLGAKCGAPERPVLCFIGDGGFWYHLGELETAARWGIKTVTVVNNNCCLSQCIRGINLAYGDTEGNKDHMYKFRMVNFAKLAEQIGCLGLRVEHPSEIRAALKTALAADVPAVVDVVTDPEHLPAWPPSRTFNK